MKKFLIPALALLLMFSIAYTNPAAYKIHDVTVPLCFDYYYTYEMVVEALKKLHKAFPHLTKLEEVAKSEEGRAIYCMTLNNPKTGKELDKPGIWVDGNIHGNEIQAAEVCLYLLDFLLHRYGVNDEITKLVDKKCFYVVPVVNPDGRYHFFTDANTSNNNRGLRRPHDDDRDGLLDEDFPDDLDGDGNICRMRKKDPQGRLKTDPEDPRLMIPVKPGEKGEWTPLGREGIDNDGDGLINEDSEGYVDPNRNWGYDWKPSYVQAGAGDYPFSGVGIKVLGKYIQARTNIAMGWTFHNFGGMFVRGPSSKAWGEYAREDVEVFDYLGEQGERIIPGYRYIVGYKDMYETYGDFDGWMYMSIGTYCFTGELSITEDESFKTIKEQKAAARRSEDEGPMSFMNYDNSFEQERLKFNDHLGQGELFVPWKPFKHPVYGDIEIGGWVKMSSRIPHPFMIKDMVHRNAAAVIFSAKQTPEVSLEVFEIKETGKNLFRLRLRLRNARAIPTMTNHARKVKLYPRDMLSVSGKGITVTAGGKLTDFYRDQVTYKEFRPEIQFLYVPGFGKAEYQFLVSGRKGSPVTIEYVSRHAGKITKTVILKQ
ncbi:MAG: hypothetical protein KAT34_07135 [Candidatus Aminicenantes bacterium]|nr:hypothetical protein [Candidatus Aminicenantes bacterium]